MARFLKDTQTLILHIPRTGGTWVEVAIEGLFLSKNNWIDVGPDWLPKKHLQLGHTYFSRLKHVIYTAAFVRHPVDYLAATYRWVSGVRRDRHQWILDVWDWHPHWEAVYYFDEDFDVFVKRMLDNCPCWSTRLFEQYVGPIGAEYCDFIGRQETLTEDFIQLMGTIGYRDLMDQHRERLRKQSRKNIGRMKSHELAWNPDLYKQVEKLERPFIERFYGENTSNKRFYKRLEKELSGARIPLNAKERILYPRPSGS